MDTDVAVIGAGIVGCLIAREIAAQAPELAVVVLDRDTVGSGASRLSAGLHFPRGASERVREMTSYSQDYYEALLQERPDLPIHPVQMSVVAGDGTAAELHEVYLERAKLVRTDGLPAGTGTGLLGLVDLPPGVRTWHCDGAQYADVHALTQTLARDLPERVELREGVRVVHLEPTAGGVTLTLGTGERMVAGRAVLAPGPWLAEPAWGDLLGPLGVRVKKVVALHIGIPPAERDPAVVFHDEDAFLLPLRERGYWLFSYTCQEWDVDPDTVAVGLSATDVEQAQAALRRYSPALADRRLTARVFCDAYSADREPLISPLAAEGRIVFAGAANGSGYRLGPAIAAAAASALLQTSPAF